MMKGKRFFVKTFGCQMNVNDSEKMAGILTSAGYEKTEKLKEADIVIVNTCSVRAKPDNKAYSFIGELKKLKKEKPELVIAVTGCVPQRDWKFILDRYPHVDIILGTFNFHKILDFIEALERPSVEILDTFLENEGEIVPSIEPLLTNPFVAYVTVQRGCNRFCTYCIVPYVRGRERSVPPENVVDEVKRLAEKGVKEVHLLGQNVDFYDYNGVRLPDLLYMVSQVEGIERVRFTTSHPAGFDISIIKAIKEIPKVCEYVHLPPQSGSNKILEKMNRGYTREEYIEKVLMLKEEVPNVALSGDFIVGFPGETVEDFEQTLSLVETCVFDQAFVFEYSPRPLTRAFSLEDDVPKKEKNRRLTELNNLLKRQAEERNLALLGSVQEILVEGLSPSTSEKMIGRTRNNKIVIVDRNDSLIGNLINVEIEEATPFYMRGKVIKQLAGVERW
ncbi:tRNA (N6-isopentenyl adenosine(37)-C2)-methylthiotransferase MiaB [Desulfurobacterium sp.]